MKPTFSRGDLTQETPTTQLRWLIRNIANGFGRRGEEKVLQQLWVVTTFTTRTEEWRDVPVARETTT